LGHGNYFGLEQHWHSGNVSGGVVVSGGTITAGSGATAADSISALTTGSQNWSSGTFVAKVTNITGSNDTLIMSGLLAASGFTVKLLATTGHTPVFTAHNGAQTMTPTAGSYIVLADDTQSSGNPLASLATLNALGLILNNSSGVGKFVSTDSIVLASQSDGNGGYDLIAEDVAAPEPTSFLLLGAVVSPMMLSRRRRALGAAGV
jgi:hypothetical protein